MTNFSLEKSIEEALPNAHICGIDEVGRGPLAGPVVAACVYIPENVRVMDFMADVKDSKKLSEKKLMALHEQIQNHCVWSVAGVSPQQIDEINILQATLAAMQNAYEHVTKAFAPAEITHALVDGNKAPELPCITQTVVKGDNVSKSIAAASIMAKVTRDNIMRDLAKEYPHYGWESNVGYPSKQHLEGIAQHGITPHHRKSFKPVREYIEQSRNAESARALA